MKDITRIVWKADAHEPHALLVYKHVEINILNFQQSAFFFMSSISKNNNIWNISGLVMGYGLGMLSKFLFLFVFVYWFDII